MWSLTFLVESVFSLETNILYWSNHLERDINFWSEQSSGANFFLLKQSCWNVVFNLELSLCCSLNIICWSFDGCWSQISYFGAVMVLQSGIIFLVLY